MRIKAGGQITMGLGFQSVTVPRFIVQSRMYLSGPPGGTFSVGTAASFILNDASSTDESNIDPKYKVNILDIYNNTGSGFINGSRHNGTTWKMYFSVSALGVTRLGDFTTAPVSSELLQVNGRARIHGKTIIGTGTISTPGDYNLYVTGGILTQKLKVGVPGTASWSDFVFNKSYRLMPLEEVENFINENKHLPDVPSAEEMVENGLDVATMDAKLLQKIEELFLYVIQMQKENEELKKRIEMIESKK